MHPFVSQFLQIKLDDLKGEPANLQKDVNDIVEDTLQLHAAGNSNVDYNSIDWNYSLHKAMHLHNMMDDITTIADNSLLDMHMEDNLVDIVIHAVGEVGISLLEAFMVVA